jgi:hypothetical protein
MGRFAIVIRALPPQSFAVSKTLVPSTEVHRTRIGDLGGEVLDHAGGRDLADRSNFG